MVITPKAAASAYQMLARMAPAAIQPSVRLDQGLGLSPSNTTRGDVANDFASLVKSAVQSVATQAQNTDRTAEAFANGKADLVDVVTAVAETGVTMDTLVTVRDRVISAYDDIMKMPI